MTAQRSRFSVLTLVLGAGTFAVLAVLAWMWGLNILHLFTTTWREAAIFWTPLAIGIALAVALIMGNSGRNDRRHRAAPTGAVITVLSLTVVAPIALSIPANYFRLNAYYAQSATVAVSDNDDYAERVPFEVASETSSNVLGDITGNVVPVKSLATSGDNGLWSALALSRDALSGYEAIQVMDLPLLGEVDQNKDVTFCSFAPNATLRDGGALPHNNLSRAIYGTVPLDVDFQSSDAYGYCDDETPIIVVPLYQVTGWFHPVNVYYGVATYNGATGDITVTRDEKTIAGIPGPTYPATLAATQRTALAANEGWWEMAVVNTSGYEASSWNTEVQLAREDGTRGDYITTLTPRGSSKSIVGVSVVQATGGTPGALNPIHVNLFEGGETRASDKNLEQTIRTTYGNIADIANDKLEAFEVTLGADGEWVLTLGRNQSVSYRAYISTDGSDVRLVNRFGDTVAEAYAPSERDGGGNVITPGADLSTLSPEELTQLGEDILAELARRASAQ